MAACIGCKVLDDDEPPMTTGGVTGDESVCEAAVDELQGCEYPYQWWVSAASSLTITVSRAGEKLELRVVVR